MNKSHFYRKSIKRLMFILSIFVLICFTFGISVYAQSAEQTDMNKSIQLINPHPVFSLRLRLENRDSASYVPGERMALSFESTKDAYVTIYKYDPEGRVIIIFSSGNDLYPYP